MRRLLGHLLVLLALPLAAGDIPLSDRPLAPIPGISQVAASASPEAVLAVFTASSEIYVQRLALDGTPLDPAATYLGSGEYDITVEVLWDGTRWIVLWSDYLAGVRIAFVDASGGVDGPYELPIPRLNELTLLGDRVVISTFGPGGSASWELRIFELTGTNSLALLGSIELNGSDLGATWTIGLDEGLGAIAFRGRYVRVDFEGTVSLHRPGGASTELLRTTSFPSIVRFMARREGGGLLVWNEGGLQGFLIGADGSVSPRFRIGPPGEVSTNVLTEAHDHGWDILFRVGTDTWLARVAVSGDVDVAPLDLGVVPFFLLREIIAVGDSRLLFERDWAAGMTIHRTSAGRLDGAIPAGFGGAAQVGARAAAGDDIDLVVWEEQSEGGMVLKATRIGSNGVPLDGSGLLIAGESLTNWDTSSYRSDFEVAYDGETFVVAWVRRDDGDTVMMRRVWPDGSLSAALALATWAHIEGVSVAGATDRRSAIAWSGKETGEAAPLSLLVPIADGRPGAAAEIGSGNHGWAVPNLAANRDYYVALFSDVAPCYVTCEHYERPYARLFTLDGTPVTEARRISDRIIGPTVPEVVSDGRDFFVVWDRALVRIDPQLAIGEEKILASRGSLSIAGNELRVDRTMTRLVYTMSGDLLRLEPLPRQYTRNEHRVASLGRHHFVVRIAGHPDRLAIRSFSEPARSADLAVVATGEIIYSPKSSDSFIAAFRVEHRGGDPVRAIDVWSDALIFGVPDQPKWLEVDLEEGESITIWMGLRREPFGGSLWVAGDVVDLVPANNADSYGPRLRRRTIGR